MEPEDGSPSAVFLGDWVDREKFISADRWELNVQIKNHSDTSLSDGNCVVAELCVPREWNYFIYSDIAWLAKSVLLKWET